MKAKLQIGDSIQNFETAMEAVAFVMEDENLSPHEWNCSLIGRCWAICPPGTPYGKDWESAIGSIFYCDDSGNRISHPTDDQLSEMQSRFEERMKERWRTGYIAAMTDGDFKQASEIKNEWNRLWKESIDSI